MAVLNPLRLVIDNYPEGQVEMLEAINNPEDQSMGVRQRAVLPRAVHRAGRLPRGAAEKVLPARPRAGGALALRLLGQVHRRGERTQTGRVVEMHCTYDPATRGGDAPRWPQGQRHDPLGVRSRTPCRPSARLYDHLFTKAARPR
jgi:glutaminyl-tRNA synthetase